MLASEHGAGFDRGNGRRQIDYQNADVALYRWETENGANPERMTYAGETLPKIGDHKVRIMAMASLAQQD